MQGMRTTVLIAEDEPVSRRLLEARLKKWGYDVAVASDGQQAWQMLQNEDAPRLVILDWMMPRMSGLEVCREIRGSSRLNPVYIIFVTGRDCREDIIEGLEAGANDYITKPFDHDELHVRIRVGERVLELQRLLADRVKELEAALSKVRQLQGLLPICCYCKKIRNDQDYWEKVETYITHRSDAEFSHGICPECYKTVVEREVEALEKSAELQKKGAGL
jgi:CheY-like chemotaxis protein